jgi:hypothetical protein
MPDAADAGGRSPQRGVAIGEKPGVYRDYPVSKGCTSPFARSGSTKWCAGKVDRSDRFLLEFTTASRDKVKRLASYGDLNRPRRRKVGYPSKMSSSFPMRR